MTTITAFHYPPLAHVRKHGPVGYKTYEPYRDWLRDEFDYRCVFCLQREQWCQIRASFHIDHFVPQAIDPDRKCDYENLLYVCASCNSVKSDLEVPNPSRVAFGNCVAVQPDGTIAALDSTGELIIELLRLDDPPMCAFRKLLLDTWQALIEAGRSNEYREWMKYPEDVPDLSRKKPSGNSRPEGVANSAYAKRSRDELPNLY